MAMDHDRLFKLLLTTFFFEFMDLFVPQAAAEIDRSSVEFLDKEIFIDSGSGERHEVDLLAKVRLRDGEACILIHVENQSTPRPDFPRRMSEYYWRIHAKFGLQVYPIAVFSYDRPLTPAADVYANGLLGLEVIRFRFHAIQLNRLDWRAFLKTPNPVASALMTKMRIAEEDRPHVKAQCVRMIVTLRLNPARAALIMGFMNKYLKLSAEEMAVYNQDMQNLAPEEEAFVLEIENEWVEKGKAEGLAEGLAAGRAQGQAHVVIRQLQRRFESIPSPLIDAIRRFPLDRLDDFADALLDFKAISDAEAWIGVQR